MALLFMDSFDHYVTADVGEKYPGAVGDSSCGIVASNGRRSSACLQLLNTGTVTPTLTPSGNVAILGVAYRQQAGTFANGEHTGIQILSGATVQLRLTLSTTGFLKVYRGASIALLGTASSALVLGTYAFLELKATIHPSTGTVQVRINGVDVLNLTGQNTAQTGVAGWSGASITALQPGSSANQFDDLYIGDGSGGTPWNDLLGDVRVDVRNPTGAGANTQFTPSAGSNWQNVDDAAPNDDTDYNTAATVGLKDTFVVQDAPVIGGTLYGVQVNLSARKTDIGTCSIAPIVRHSTLDHQGTVQNPATTYAYLRQIYSVNPVTSLAWVEADFNAAEFGYIRTA